MAKLDKEKIGVINDLINVILKVVLAIASLVAFFIVLHFTINAKTTIARVQGVLLGAFISGTLFVIIRHLFPKK